MFLPLANNLTHLASQFCRLVSKRNEYAEWATQIACNAINAPDRSCLPVTVKRPVPRGNADSRAQISLASDPNGEFETCRLSPPSINSRLGERSYAKRLSESLAFFIFSVILLVGFGETAFAQVSDGQTKPQSKPQWATNKAFQQARLRPFSISWQAAPLRERLSELARQQGISVFLDRRVDPRTPISLAASNVTMEQLLLQLCDQQELGFCRLGDSFYLGPKRAAKHLLISSEDTSKVAQASKTRRKAPPALLKKAAFSWPDLTTPEEVLNVLIEGANLKLENADLLPHDLMASGNIPPLTLGQRLRLLLIQFDLDYELERDSKTLALRRLPDLAATGSVRFSDVGLSLAQYQAIKAQATDSRMRRNKRSITVTGPVEDLVLVRDFIVKSFSPPSPSVGDQQFTLTVTNRRSAILAAVGKQLQMSVDTSSADPASMKEVVSLSVANVSLQELLDQIVVGAEVTCVVTEGRIVVKSR